MTGTLLGNHPVAVIGLAAATAAYAALHRLGASYGSTKQERRTSYRVTKSCASLSSR